MNKIKKILSRRIWKLTVSSWLILLFSLAVFMTLCFVTIAKSSVWFDEAFGAYMIKFNFFDIAYYTSLDVHPPLFYWALKLWGGIFGFSEIGLRSMSVFFGCIAMFFGYLLVEKLFNRKAANLSVLIMAVSPMLVRYGQEMRMYTMVMAIAVAATYALVIAMESKKRLPWIMYGILVALGMWTHYFIVVVWVAHWVWRATIIWHEDERNNFWKRFFAGGWGKAYLLALVLFLPWLPLALKQTFIVQAYGFWIPPVTVNTIPNFLTNAVYYLNSDQVNGWLALGFLAFVGLMVYLGVKIYRSHGEPWRKNYRLIASIAFVPLLMLFIMSMPPLRSYFVDRYLITSALFISVFIGVTYAYGLEKWSRKMHCLPIIVTILLLAIGVSNVWSLGNYNKTNNSSNNARQIMDAAYSRASDGEPIISSSMYIFYEEVFYETGNHPTYFIAPDSYPAGSLEMLKNNPQHKITDINAFTKDNNKVWYVGWCGESCDSFAAPYDNWKKLQEATVNDSVSGKATYKAIEYKIR